MVDIDALVAKCKADGASDLHLICGLPPKYRKDGQLQDMDTAIMTPDDCFAVARFLARFLRARNLRRRSVIGIMIVFAGA